MIADHRSKPLPRVIFISDLGVVWKHCRQHTPLSMLGSHVRRAGAEATILVQRKTAAVIQHRELMHVDVHASLIPVRQLRPRTQANNRDTHKVNASATSPAGRVRPLQRTAATLGTSPRSKPHDPVNVRGHRTSQGEFVEGVGPE